MAFDAYASERPVEKLVYVRKLFGAGSYGWTSAGRLHHAQSVLNRLMNCIGGYTAHVDAYSVGAGHTASSVCSDSDSTLKRLMLLAVNRAGIVGTALKNLA